MNTKLKLGIVGCGAIGSYIATYCERKLSDKIELIAVYDKVRSKAEGLVKSLKKDIDITDVDGLVRKSDLVVEAASIDAVRPVAERTLLAGKSLMVMSVGGLLGNEDLFELAEKKGARLFVPSGALCGLDALKGAAMSDIKSVVLTTKKPKEGLEGAPFLEKNKIDLAGIDSETVIFEGDVLEAIKGFPKNINVAALLSLAGIGPKKIKVKIVVSPSGKENIHELQISGSFGEFYTRTKNIPFPENPKTSFLAALSAVATLKGIVSSIKIGT